MNQKQNKNITKKITIISICTFLVCSLGWFCYKKNLERVEQNKIEEKQLILSVVKNSLDEYFHHGGEKPQLVRVNGRDYQLEYSTNNDLENHVKKLISRYRSAHIAVVVLDNETEYSLKHGSFKKL